MNGFVFWFGWVFFLRGYFFRGWYFGADLFCKNAINIFPLHDNTELARLLFHVSKLDQAT